MVDNKKAEDYQKMMDNLKSATGGLPLIFPEAAEASAPVSAPVIEQAPAPAVNVNLPIDVDAEVKAALANQQNIGKYVAPQIQIPQEDPEIARARKVELDQLKTKFDSLNPEYEKNLKDAEDADFRSSIFAAIGNYLPTAIAGATAMKTKAAVSAPKLPTISAKDSASGVKAKYKTDYENLNDRYKAALKESGGGLTAKDKLYANVAQAQIKANEYRQNSTNANAATSANLRGSSMKTADQEKNELSDKQLDTFRTANNVLSEFGRVRELKKGIETGPFAKKRNQVASVLGIDDPDVTALKSKTLNVLSEKIKALSGAAASDSEVGRLQVTLPDIGQDDDVFERLLQEAEDQIKRAIEIDKATFAKYQNKNVKGYGPDEESKAPAAKSAPSAGKIISSGGKRYRVINDKGDLEEVK